MSEPSTVRPHKKTGFTTANIFVYFQRYPGTDVNSVVNGGKGKLAVGTDSVDVLPQGKGLYTLKMPKDSQGIFELFDTSYKVIHHEIADLEKKSDPKFRITDWKKLGKPEQREGVQRRLQMLGYYLGKVDDIFGPLTERAVLNFQADNNPLRIDGIPGDKTQRRLNREFKRKNTKQADQYYLRKVPLRFERAVTGPPQEDSSDVDDRGTEAGGRGCTMGVAVGKENEVKLRRDQIDPKARLCVASDKPAIAKIVSPAGGVLPRGRKENTIRYKGIKEGVAKIQVYYETVGGRLLSELQVVVSKMIQVDVVAHLTQILARGFIGPVRPGDHRTSRTSSQVNDLFEEINAIWRPLGIEFKLQGCVSTSHRLSNMGRVTIGIPTNALGQDEHDELWTANNVARHVNVYFVPQIFDATAAGGGGIQGQAFNNTQTGPNQVPGVTLGDGADSNDLAHELGHILTLTQNPSCHADESDTNRGAQSRNDTWCRRRLMAMYNPDFPHRPWQDNGYGRFVQGGITRMNRGALITIKDLPQDQTDGEHDTAKGMAPNPY